MKKVFALLLVLIFTIPLLAGPRRRIIPRNTRDFQIRSFNPANNWQFGNVPRNIQFQWEDPGRISYFNIKIQVWSSNTRSWVNYLNRKRIQGNLITIKYNHRGDFRWQVTGFERNMRVCSTKWTYAKYRGSMGGRQQGGVRGTMNIVPRPVRPANNSILRNYPRNVRCQWYHSSNRNFRNYEFIIEIYHPRTRRWEPVRHGNRRSRILTRNNFVDYNFPADRRGRWRVRGINRNTNRATAWSSWFHFHFRARH